jgi:O-antigen/teichoic acid export membrane protein
MVIVLAKMGSPEVVGRFAFGLSIAAPILMLSNLQLRQVQASDAINKYAFGDYFTVRWLTTSMALLVIAGVCFFARRGSYASWVLLVIGLAKAVESIGDVIHGLFQKHERMDIIAISMSLKGVLSIAAMGATYWYTHSLLASVLAMGFAWTITILLYDMNMANSFLRQIGGTATWRSGIFAYRCSSMRAVWRLMVESVPLGAVMCLISLHTNIPRLVIERCSGEHALGLFVAISYFMQIGFLIEVALGQAAIPRLAQFFAQRRYDRFQWLVWQCLFVALALGIAGVGGAMIAGRFILMLVYGAEYAQHNTILVWMMVAAGLGYGIGFVRAAITAACHFNVQVPLFGLLTIVTAVGSYLWVPSYGLAGAAAAIICARCVTLLVGFLMLASIVMNAQRRSCGIGA